MAHEFTLGALDHAHRLRLLPARLSTEESETGRAEMLIEAAGIYEQRGSDLEQALQP